MPSSDAAPTNWAVSHRGSSQPRNRTTSFVKCYSFCLIGECKIHLLFWWILVNYCLLFKQAPYSFRGWGTLYPLPSLVWIHAFLALSNSFCSEHWIFVWQSINKTLINLQFPKAACCYGFWFNLLCFLVWGWFPLVGFFHAHCYRLQLMRCPTFILLFCLSKWIIYLQWWFYVSVPSLLRLTPRLVWMSCDSFIEVRQKTWEEIFRLWGVWDTENV